MELPGPQVRDLRDALLAAFDLNGLRQFVRIDLGKDVAAGVNFEQDTNAVAFDLIMRAEQVGSTEKLVAALNAARGTNEKVLAYCRKHAPILLEKDRPPEVMAEQVQGAIAIVAERARQPDGGRVREILEAFGEDLAAARSVIDLLEKYKLLHDQLHTIDYQLYKVTGQAAAVFRRDPDARVDLNTYTGQLRDLARAAADTVKGLPAQQSERGWIEKVRRAVELLEQGLAGATGDPEGRALTLLKMVLSTEPSRINAQMGTLAIALHKPLRGLSTALSGVQAADPQRAAPVREGLDDLEQLRTRLPLLIGEHDYWQQVDRNLRFAPERAAQPIDNLLLVWPELAQAARELCDLRRGSAWAEELQAAARRFDAASDANEPAEQRLALGDFARVARRRFFEVDTELKELCQALMNVAKSLGLLLQIIGR